MSIEKELKALGRENKELREAIEKLQQEINLLKQLPLQPYIHPIQPHWEGFKCVCGRGGPPHFCVTYTLTTSGIKQ